MNEEPRGEALISVGLINLARVVRPSWLSPGLLPDLLLTGSRCLRDQDEVERPCDFIPEAWEATGIVERRGLSVLALTANDGQSLRDEIAIGPPTDECDQHLIAALEAGLPAVGTLIGFEVLGYEWGGFHSWLCHSLETEIEQALGIRPGLDGLLPDLPAARSVADYTNALGDEVDPVLWLPFAYLQAPAAASL